MERSALEYINLSSKERPSLEKVAFPNPIPALTSIGKFTATKIAPALKGVGDIASKAWNNPFWKTKMGKRIGRDTPFLWAPLTAAGMYGATRDSVKNTIFKPNQMTVDKQASIKDVAKKGVEIADKALTHAASGTGKGLEYAGKALKSKHGKYILPPALLALGLSPRIKRQIQRNIAERQSGYVDYSNDGSY